MKINQSHTVCPGEELNVQATVGDLVGWLLQEVFDHDTFSADDSMGTVEVDLDPLVAAASLHEGLHDVGNIQIGKWLATKDNALIEDSPIRLVDGDVRQDMSLKLQNVESGELEIGLTWMPLNQ